MSSFANLQRISPVDYGVFGLSLVFPIIIACYYTFVQKQTSLGSYLMGNRHMGALPVSFSMTVSYLSAVTITGVPGEIAYSGFLLPVTWIVASALGLIVFGNLFIPVFYKMRLTSVYEYLELRYDSKAVRLLGTLSFLGSSVIYMGVVVYAPCLALKTITGVDIIYIILIGGFVGTLYTVMGGLKAVIWTDFFQAFVMLGGLIAIMIRGVFLVGSVGEVWRVGEASGRIQWFNWDPSPFTRNTTLGVFFGQFLLWGSLFGCNQTQVQRFCATRSLKQARWTFFLAALQMALVVGCAVGVGLVVYATYWSCDPMEEGRIGKKDELPTLFVLEHLVEFTGLPGIFVASILSGALSSLSSGLNSLAAVIWEDVLKSFGLVKRTPDHIQVLWTRCIACLFGFIAIGLAYAATELDGVLQMGNMSAGVFAGSTLALFILGFFTTTANKFGAILGFVCGNALTIWMAVGTFIRKSELAAAAAQNKVALPRFTEGCDATQPLTSQDLEILMANRTVPEKPFFYIPDGDWQTILYSTSFNLYAIVGFFTCFIVCLVTSILVRLIYEPKPVDQMLLHPLVRFRASKYGLRTSSLPPYLSNPYGPSSKSAGRGGYPSSSGGSSSTARAGHHHVWPPMDVDENAHFRWPSPSLPPTLKKQAGRGKVKRDPEGDISSDGSRMGGLTATTSGTRSTDSDRVRASEESGEVTEESAPPMSHYLQPNTFFSRQHVISACARREANGSLSDSGSSSSSGSESVSDTTSKSSTETTTSAEDDDDERDGEAVELDEFGDVVPEHLRKKNRKKQRRRKHKTGKYEVAKEQQREENNAGWNTDF